MAKNLIKQYLDDKERTYQDGGVIKDTTGRYVVSKDKMDYYNAAMQRMKELYEGDPNHKYHTIDIDNEGRRIKEKNQKSDIEQNLSFEEWLNTPTGSLYNDVIVFKFSTRTDPLKSAEGPSSVTKTRRGGKEITISKEVPQEFKEKFISEIMKSNDPTEYDVSKAFSEGGPGPVFTKETKKTIVHPYDETVSLDETTKKTGKRFMSPSLDRKMARFIKKAKKGNPKFKINE